MIDRHAVIATARSYVGTPIHHCGRKKEVGVDCAGLAAGVFRELGYPHRDVRNYAQIPDKNMLIDLCRECMDEVPRGEHLPGDIGLFWWDRVSREPRHLGILCDGTMVHATNLAGRQGLHRRKGVSVNDLGCVQEVEFGQSWERRLIHTFRLRGIGPWQPSPSLR